MATRNLLPILALVACSGRGTPGGTTGPTSGGSASVGSGSAVAIGSANPAPIPLPPAPPGVKVTLADVGLETSSLDRNVEPCTDFYQFACGGWLASNPVPPDRARWGRISEIDERVRIHLRALLEEAAKGIGVDAPTKRLGDYYASCMDEAVVERAGLSAIQPLLAKTTKVKDAKTWMAAFGELHKHGLGPIWLTSVSADLKDSTTNIVYLDTSGLGLPDRDYYVSKDLKDKLAAYKVHVGKLLALAGIPAGKADAAAADVLAIETELAKLTRTATQRNDTAANYNPTDAKALAKRVKSIDWKTYWKTIGLEPSKKLVVTTPAFFDSIDKLRARFKPAQWGNYFTYHLVSGFAHALPKPIEQQAFELERALSGVEQQQDRAKRCIAASAHALGEQLGALYIAKHFTSASRQAASTLVEALVKAMGEEIARLDWMTDATKQVAAQKLGKIVKMVGYPDKPRAYDFAIKREDFTGNALRSAMFEMRRAMAKAGKPVDRSEWQMNAFQVNAYYEPTANSTALPAGILQTPFFGQDRAIAANLGGIGMVIGHELTHGFDDQGAKFDPDGNFKNWWQADDAKRFTEKGQCLVDQYSTFEAMPKGFVNGELTLGENIADLGGVKMAFKAYRSLRKDATKIYVADGFTEDQQFFIAVAQAWCNRDRPAEIQRRLTTDSHSPPKFRVYGSLRNLKEFAEAFRCSPGTPMNPAKTCSVW